MSNDLPELQTAWDIIFSMEKATDYEFPHRRYNPLLREWVLVSPQRAARPWQGQTERKPAEMLPAYDPNCYLCPSNKRAGEKQNPDYTGTFVFDNDFPALLQQGEVATLPTSQEILLRAEPEPGICRVICFSPRHDLTIPQMALKDVEEVIRTWVAQSRELEALDWVQYVQIFENKGAIMGCSNPHPHSQLWATAHVPNEPAKELVSQQEYMHSRHSTLLEDYLREETRLGERLVVANEHFSALVPFWAVWPYEVMIVTHHPVAHLADYHRKNRLHWQPFISK